MLAAKDERGSCLLYACDRLDALWRPKAERDVDLADWASSTLTGCARIISSCFLLAERILIGSSLLDVSYALGPLCMPPDIGSRKCLLAEQRSRSDLGILVLVQTFLPFSGSGSFDDDKQEPEEAVGSEDIEKEVAGSEKGIFWKRGLFGKVDLLDILEIFKILGTRETSEVW